MSAHLDTVARLRGPLAAAAASTNASDVGGGFAVAIGTTHAVYTIPAAWKGRRVDISVKNHASSTATNCVWFAFGTASNMEVDRAAVISGSAPAWTGAATIGRPILAGETRDYYIDPAWTHFAIESDENTNKPIFYMFLSDYPIARR